MAVAFSAEQYKHDLHIISDQDQQEPQEVEALVRYLKSHKVYTKKDYVLGQSIFDAVGDGIDKSRYTMLWVTEEDFKTCPQLTFMPYFRQNALARLMDAPPIPKGKERIIIALNGLSQQDFKNHNREFKQNLTVCVQTDKDWMVKVEKFLFEKKVFHPDCDNENVNQLNSFDLVTDISLPSLGSEQDYPPVTPSHVGEPNQAGHHGAEQYPPSGEQYRGNHGSRSEDTLSPKFNSMELGLTERRSPGEGLESVPGDNLHSAAPSTLGSGWAEGGEQDYPPVTPSRVGEPNPAGLHGAEQYPSGEQCRGNHGSRSEDTLSPKFVSKHLDLTNTRRPAPGEQWFSKARPSGEGGASLPLPEEKKPVAAVIPVAQGPEDILDGAELQRREDDPHQDMEDDPPQDTDENNLAWLQ